MNRIALFGASAISLLAMENVAVAHHSFAMFDRTQTASIAGTVKELQLVNPHGWLRIMVPDAKGAVNEWSVELGGAGQLERSGWNANVIHAGDKVLVELHPLRDGSYGGQLVSLTLPNGQVLGGQRPPGGR